MFGTWENENYGVYKTGKGVLEITDNVECPICLEMKRGISHPNCNHTTCIPCFKRCYYGDYSGEPSFPYPDIEDEYDDDIENIKWEIDYPLIKKYNEEYNKWEERMQHLEETNNLDKCPLCRK
jgi:hypothetical protein